MPTMNESALEAYWSRVGLLVETCLSATVRHPVKAFRGCMTIKAGSDPTRPDDEQSEYAYGVIGGYMSGVWYSYSDGGYTLPYVKSIASQMFYYNPSLRYVYAPTATSVDDESFGHCIMLSDVSLPLVSSIGYRTFMSCYRLDSISLPACTYVESMAFYDCRSLRTVDLPACETIGEFAFHGCQALVSASLPACTEIHQCAFQECSSLQGIDLPKCSRIGADGFAFCSSIAVASLPVCELIGARAFRMCDSLSSLYLTSVSSVPTLGVDAFYETPIGGYPRSAGYSMDYDRYGTIYVPSSLYSEFVIAERWSSFMSMIVGV